MTASSRRIAPILKIYTNNKGEFLHGKIIPIYQSGAGGPRIDPQKRVVAKIQELMELNFPEIEISVDDAGVISYIKEVSSIKRERTEKATGNSPRTISKMYGLFITW